MINESFLAKYEKNLDCHEESIKMKIYKGSESISFHEFLMLCRTSKEFCRFFGEALVGAKLKLFRWETPKLNDLTLENKFECTLSKSPELGRKMDFAPFKKLLNESDSTIVVASNLSGDSKLIIPQNLGQDCDYSSIGTFLTTASGKQIQDLWREVGESALRSISDKPIWLSTAGAGVAWLHVRIDQTPKYYIHTAYRN